MLKKRKITSNGSELSNNSPRVTQSSMTYSTTNDDERLVSDLFPQLSSCSSRFFSPLDNLATSQPVQLAQLSETDTRNLFLAFDEYLDRLETTAPNIASTSQTWLIDDIESAPKEEAKNCARELLAKLELSSNTVEQYCEMTAIIEFAEILNFLSTRNQLTAKVADAIFRYNDSLAGLPQLMSTMAQYDYYSLDRVLRLLNATHNKRDNFNLLNRVIDILNKKGMINKKSLSKILAINCRMSLNGILALENHDILLHGAFQLSNHSYVLINFLRIINTLNHFNADLNQFDDELQSLLSSPDDTSDFKAIHFNIYHLLQNKCLVKCNLHLVLMTRRKCHLLNNTYIYNEMAFCLSMLTKHAASIDENKWKTALANMFTGLDRQENYDYLGLNIFFALMDELELFNDDLLPYCTYHVTRFLCLYEDWIRQDRDQMKNRFFMVLNKALKFEANINIHSLMHYRKHYPVLLVEALENDLIVIGTLSQIFSLALKHDLKSETVDALCSEPEKLPFIIEIFSLITQNDAWSTSERMVAQQEAALIEEGANCERSSLKEVTAACIQIDVHQFKNHAFIKKIHEVMGKHPKEPPQTSAIKKQKRLKKRIPVEKTHAVSSTTEDYHEPQIDDLFPQLTPNSNRFFSYPDHLVLVQSVQTDQPLQLTEEDMHFILPAFGVTNPVIVDIPQAHQVDTPKPSPIEEAKQLTRILLAKSNLSPKSVEIYCESESIIDFAQVLDFLSSRDQLTAKTVNEVFRYNDALAGLPQLMSTMAQHDYYDLNRVLRVLKDTHKKNENFVLLNRVIDLLNAKGIFDRKKFSVLLHVNCKFSFNSLLSLDRHESILSGVFDLGTTSISFVNFLHIIDALYQHDVELDELNNEIQSLLRHPKDVSDFLDIFFSIRHLSPKKRTAVENVKMIFMTRRKCNTTGKTYIYNKMSDCLSSIGNHAASIDEMKWKSALIDVFTKNDHQHNYDNLGLDIFFELMSELNIFDDELLPYCTYRVTRFLSLYEDWIRADPNQVENRFRLVLAKAINCESEINIHSLMHYREGYHALLVKELETNLGTIGIVSQLFDLALKFQLNSETLDILCFELERTPYLIEIFSLINKNGAWSTSERKFAQQVASLADSCVNCTLPNLKNATAACVQLDNGQFQNHMLIAKINEILNTNWCRTLTMT